MKKVLVRVAVFLFIEAQILPDIAVFVAMTVGDLE